MSRPDAGGPELSPAELDPAELSPAELDSAELDPAELSPAELNPAEPDPADPGPAELSPAAESVVIPGAPHVTPTPPTVSRRTAMIAAAAAGLAFAALAVWIAGHGGAVPALDHGVHRWAIAHRGPASLTAAHYITWGGVSWVVFPALIAVGAAAAAAGSSVRRRAGAGLLLCLIASTGNYAEAQINHLIGRARPPGADWATGVSGLSFPSGHTTAATLAVLIAAWVLAARVRPGWQRGMLWAGAAAWAGAVGWSRVWLGVHWPTDVAAGWLFGLTWFGAAVAVTLTARRPPRRR